MKKKWIIVNLITIMIILMITSFETSPRAYAAEEYSNTFKIDGNLYGIINNSKKLILLDFNNDAQEVDLSKKVKYAGKTYTITKIGEMAFNGCNLKEISIPDNIDEIQNSAFYNCKNLVSVTIPNSIYRIEAGTFKFCDNLTDITLPNTLEYVNNDAFFHASCYVYSNGLYIIDNKIVLYADTDTTGNNVIIPDGIIGIADGAFMDTSVEKVSLPNSINFIGISAFKNCNNLSEINLPESLVTIEESAFYNTALKSITLPAKLKIINTNTFYNCVSLKSINLKNVIDIRSWAFAKCSSLIKVNIPSKVNYISHHAFSKCESIQEITIGNSIKEINDEAFAGCISLYKLTFKGKCPKFYHNFFNENTVFTNCNNLKSISVPSKHLQTYKKEFNKYKIKENH